MRLHGQYGIAVQYGHDELVARVAQVFDDGFEFVADVLNDMVGMIAEEHLDYVRRRFEAARLRIFGDLSVQQPELGGITAVGRVVQDYFLAGYAALEAESEHPPQQVHVHIGIEHRRVVVRLVGEEHRHRDEHRHRQSLAEPDGPVALAGHTVAGVVEDVEDDEHDDADDDRYAQSALADNGTERCADEEEDDADQRQRELVDGLDVVQTDQLVAVTGHQTLELEVAHLLLDSRQSLVDDLAALVGRQPAEHRVDVEAFSFRQSDGLLHL